MLNLMNWIYFYYLFSFRFNIGVFIKKSESIFIGNLTFLWSTFAILYRKVAKQFRSIKWSNCSKATQRGTWNSTRTSCSKKLSSRLLIGRKIRLISVRQIFDDLWHVLVSIPQYVFNKYGYFMESVRKQVFFHGLCSKD